MAEIKTLTVNGKTYTVADPDAAHIDDSSVGEKAWSSAQIAKTAANALKGAATGNPVCITDCSPVEHEMSVKVDVPGAKVTKYGKNLFDINEWVKNGCATIAEDGTYRPISNRLNVEYGTDKENGFYMPINGNVPITITATFKTTAAYPDKGYVFIAMIYYTDGTSTRINWEGKFVNEVPQWSTFSGKSDPSKTIKKVSYAWVNKTPYMKDFQIEVGQTATEYEPYVEPITYTADENGDVKGVMSVYPSTTLIAEDGTTVTAEYNKDTNKVIESLVNAIIALGGNV